MADRPNRYTAILRKALTDHGFRRRFKGETHGALAEHGVTIPEGVTVHVHKADEKTAHIVLPTLRAGRSVEQMTRRASADAGRAAPTSVF